MLRLKHLPLATLCLITNTTFAAELVGWGTDTKTGSGGKIIRVTSLASHDPGTLREALSALNPYIIATKASS